MIEFCTSSPLEATRREVWTDISTMPGVNYELGPFVKMTWPREHEVLQVDVTSGQVLFRSWLLLFGFLPFDRHALTLERIDDGVGFIEESSSWLQRRWRHERTLIDLPAGGCALEDRLVIEPRLRVARPVVAFVAERLFEHRHRRLARRFGGGPAASVALARP